jgi:uncharacterized cupredoxin-like copper-binding protein
MGMKTNILFPTLIAAALSVATAHADDKTLGEKTSETIDKAVDKSKEVGREVVDKSKEVGRVVAEDARKAADVVTDAVTPDADARKVEVTLTEHKIDMPRQLVPGKTAFVVRNTGKQEHNFEITGEGIEQKFYAPVDPNASKTLHVELKPGSYKVFCPVKDHAGKGMELDFTVK